MSMKVQAHIRTKILRINSNDYWHFTIYEKDKFYTKFELTMSTFYYLEAGSRSIYFATTKLRSVNIPYYLILLT